MPVWQLTDIVANLKEMKYFKQLMLASVILLATVSCKAQTNSETENTPTVSTENVEVYYFHFTRRCATCNAVQSVSEEAVKEFYGDKVKFFDINLDEEDGEAKGKELEVSGQTLLIVAGNTKINITNEGFMNARSNPDKLKTIIKEKIDGVIE